MQTPTFTIAGQIEGAALKVKTSYFGETEVRLSHLWSIRTLETPPSVLVVIDSARYAGPGFTWLETRIDVRKGAAMKIKATGQIDMYPLGNEVGMYMATPASVRP